MDQVKVYSYKKCSTCIKALKFLEKKGIELNVIDLTEQAPTKAELQAMLVQYKGDLKRLFNVSGVQYRELNIKDKLKTMTKQQAVDLLAGNGRLVKRPFLLNGKQGLVGFKEAEWLAFFISKNGA